MGVSILILWTCVPGACTREVFGTAADYRSVVTVRIDEDVYDFSNIRTYQLVATVDELMRRSKEKPEPLDTMDHTRDESILATVEAQLNARGLVNVESLADETTGETPSPDVIVIAALLAEPWGYEGLVRFESFNNQTVYYPGPPVEMEYDIHSVILTMVSPSVRVKDRPQLFYALWSAGIHGSYSDMTAQTIASGIKKAFAQSPYIKAATSVGGEK
ncbi:MAG: DUF4136 domain-containing protein [Deltaproteobacteria bacterium]|nr:DUF4136 domain-containing protein [Deltaproteobacteria bacterium]